MLAIAVHGGAGPAPAVDRQGALRAGVAAAVAAGWDELAAGRSALDAVAAAVRVLEDEPLFNAGRGSALTAAGTVEMDAAIMAGEHRRIGAVAAVSGIRHPVDAARAVLDDGRHALLCGAGAEAFARERGIELVAPEWLVTARARERLAAWRAAREPRAGGHGTVGAVARDAGGHLAAATSTGGVVGKLPGRIGDSPLAGAGTWADDATVAVSATGDGEAIIRAQLAHALDAGLRHTGRGLEEAAARALEEVRRFGGAAGLVAIDATGAVMAPFVTGAMTRGWRTAGGPAVTAVLPGDEAYAAS